MEKQTIEEELSSEMEAIEEVGDLADRFAKIDTPVHNLFAMAIYAGIMAVTTNHAHQFRFTLEMFCDHVEVCKDEESEEEPEWPEDIG